MGSSAPGLPSQTPRQRLLRISLQTAKQTGKKQSVLGRHLSLRNRNTIEDGESSGNCSWLGWPQNPGIEDR